MKLKNIKEKLFIFIYKHFPIKIMGYFLTRKFFKQQYYKFIID
jgi:hypothetical protein